MAISMILRFRRQEEAAGELHGQGGSTLPPPAQPEIVAQGA